MQTVEEINESIKTQNTCYLPFSGLRDLYLKCTEIIQILQTEQGRKNKKYTEANIPFTEFEGYGRMINLEDLKTEEQGRLITEKDEQFDLLIQSVIVKYQISGNIKSLQCG